jgi:hypothetical protein
MQIETAWILSVPLSLFVHQVDEESIVVNGDIMP